MKFQNSGQGDQQAQMQLKDEERYYLGFGDKKVTANL